MASSTYALLSSLKRRRERLEKLLKEPELLRENITTDIDEIDDYEEERRWEQEKRWETLSIAESKEELEKEINILKTLIEQAREILKTESEVKLTELKKVMESLGDEKILIFTESKDTLEYLLYDVTFSYLEGKENELADWGYNWDKKKGKKQIVYGLLTDEQGEPISIEGFCGNTTSQCNPARGITLSGDTCCHEKETE